MQVEIKKDLQLSSEDSVLLDMHSFYNVINIISGELQVLEFMAGDEETLRECVDLAFRIKDSLSNASSALEHAKNLDNHIQFIRDKIEELMQNHPHLKNDPEAQESVSNIESVFSILQVRVKEILARLEDPGKWEEHELENLLQNFMDVFAAIEKNSKGRYRFVYNLAAQEARDYYIHLKFESVDGAVINMPPVFQDVMRDLIANARKYTEPGGKVLAGLWDDGERLRFAVEDTGKGIPENEIENVVDFGFRGSNVGNKKTMGGGFGMTKAYWATQQFGGRMWVDSAEGQGTRVDIHLPRPEQK